MSTIGSLAVNVTANTEKFSKGMGRARSDANSFAKAAKGLEKTVLTLGAALGTKMSFDRFKGDLKTIDDLGDAAARLSTSMQRLGGLEFAGGLTGLSDEQMVGGLTKMLKAVGSGSSVFGDLGLSVGKLKGMGADDMFVTIADAINRMPNAAEQTAASMAVFGKGGAEFLELIAKGGTEIRSMMDEWKQNNPMMTEDSAKWAEGALKSMTRLQSALKTAELAVAVKLAPLAEVIAKQLTVGTLSVSGALQGSWSAGRGQHMGSPGLSSGGGLGPLIDNFLPGLSYVQKMHDMITSGPTPKTYTTGGKPLPDINTAGTPFGMGGAFAMGAMGMMASEHAKMVADEMVKAQDAASWRNLGGTEEARISALLSSSLGTSATSRSMGGAFQVRGNAALEQGTAAAFSQEKRSQQAGQQVEENKKQTSLQKQMVKGLQDIDKTIKRTMDIAIVNIA